MEASRRALEFSKKAIDAYRKTLLVDKVTSDDESSPPVYLLDEISEILRSSSLDLIQEIVEYTFRRLRNRSPQVKHKVLRFIKYTVDRAGSEYRRELQSHSASIREFFTFQGYVDPIKGDALDKAIRDAAHEAIKAIYSSNVSLAASKGIGRRIEGFGSGDFSKSMLGFGSSFVGGYKTADPDEVKRGSYGHSDRNKYTNAVICKYNNGREIHDNLDNRFHLQMPSGDSDHRNFRTQNGNVASPEDRLVDIVTASGGVRIQPTRESLQSFMSTAKELDATKLASALKTKIRSPSWQVRLKAVCVLKAILHKMDANLLQIIEADEGAMQGCVQECLLSPQTTLRKKAEEVLHLLLALNKEKNHDGSPNSSMDDTLPTIINLFEEPFFTTELDQEEHRDDDFLGVSPAATLDANQAIDVFSSQIYDSVQLHTVGVSLGMVIDDPFDGMCIHGSHESAGLYAEDLLSSGWTGERVQHVDEPCRDLDSKQTYVFPRTNGSQAETSGQSQPTESMVDNFFVTDFRVKCSTSIGKGATWSVLEAPWDGKTYPVQFTDNIPGHQNVYLNDPYMVSMGMVGPLHNIQEQQQCPGGLQGFGLGVSIATAGLNQRDAGFREGLGDACPKGFDFSSKPAADDISTSAGFKHQMKSFDFTADQLCAN